MTPCEKKLYSVWLSAPTLFSVENDYSDILLTGLSLDQQDLEIRLAHA